MPRFTPYTAVQAPKKGRRRTIYMEDGKRLPESVRVTEVSAFPLVSSGHGYVVKLPRSKTLRIACHPNAFTNDLEFVSNDAFKNYIDRVKSAIVEYEQALNFVENSS